MMEAQMARIMLRAGAAEIAKLSIRICEQVKAGEPLGELDIVNDLNRIGEALAGAGGVEYRGDCGRLVEMDDCGP